MQRWLSILLPLIGLAMFAGIVYNTGIENIIEVFRSVRPAKLALTPLIVLVIMLFRGLRWQYIIRHVGLEYSLVRAMTVWAIGFFASSVTPAKAGDAVRAFYVKDETGCTFGEAFLTVFVDRIWDLIFILLSGLVTVILFSSTYVEIPSVWLIVVVVVAIFGVVYLATHGELMKKVLHPVFNSLVPKRYKERFALNFNSFYDSLTAFKKGVRQHVIAFLLTTGCWLLIFVLAYIVAQMLSVPIEFKYLVLIWPIITFVELIPISVSGLGTRDATMIYLLSLVGISSAAAVGFSLGYLLIGTYLTAVFGFFFWLRHPVKFRGS